MLGRSLLAALLVVTMHAEDTPSIRVQVSQFHMGMMVDLIVYASTEEAGKAACADAFTRIASLNRILSDYEPDSELNRLCAHAGQGPQPISDELFTVLTAAQRLAQACDGRFDVTAAPLIRLWRAARKAGCLPDSAALSAAMPLVGYRNLRLDAGTRSAELVLPGMHIDLGAIAKGYIGDQALAILRQRGIAACAFVAGGDMVFGAAPPGTTGWPVRPAKSDLAEMALADCACAVSGDTAQFLEVDGVRYSHVIDATTGRALTERRMCIVISPRGIDADALSTIGTLLPEADFSALAAQTPGTRQWVFTLK
jgi:thiamine biosynthesis lipoprotein